jgi:hypothetical protein
VPKKADDFATTMKGLAKGFDDALKNAGKGRGGLSPGRYQVKVTEHEFQRIKRGQKAGNLGSLFRFEVVEGKKQGKKHSLFTNLELIGKEGENKGQPVGLSMFLGALQGMGIEVKKSDMKKLDKKAEEAVGRIIEIDVVAGDRGYTNTFVRDLVETEAESDEDFEEGGRGA